MFPFSHLFGSFIVILFLGLTGRVEVTGLTITLSVFLSLLPDADAVWKKELIDRHNSLLHTPIFWILMTLIAGFTVSWELGAIIITTTLFHIFTDYVTGRTIGVPLLYPFGRTYSLYPLNPETADFDPLRPDKRKLKEHISNYLENKPLLVFELLINIAGVAALLILVNML